MYQNLNYNVIIIQEYTNYKRFVNFLKKRNIPEINIPNQTVRSYMQNMKKKLQDTITQLYKFYPKRSHAPAT